MTDTLLHAHSTSPSHLLQELQSDTGGLTGHEAARRLARHGRNQLPQPEPIAAFDFFIRQFRSPLIYVLLLAAAVSAMMGDWTDAGFIFAVLLINALIGGYQEYAAQRSAQALHALVMLRARVVRDGEVVELDASLLVPGDVVLIESGMKVPADLRLLEIHGLTIDESLLTGESLPVEKRLSDHLPPETALGDRVNMAFAGTVVTKGRARCLVVATSSATELGKIASSLLTQEGAQAPLLIRMERFTRRISLAIALVALLLVAVSSLRGMPLEQVFILVVALAVSAIPEGLPVAITVALAVSMSRMARRNVIVRQLVAIEALGSCTCIATDKTGTLTMNQLTACRIQLPDGEMLEVDGEGVVPEGEISFAAGSGQILPMPRLEALARAASLASEGVLARRDGLWVGHGDAADVAMLVMAHKIGVIQPECQARYPQIAYIPYEPENRFAASLNQSGGVQLISVKGAVETVLSMCEHIATERGVAPLDREGIERQAHALSEAGYRVLAVAQRQRHAKSHGFDTGHLHGLVLLGLVGMSDPPRKEAAAAIKACHRSGIRVVMLTGDHPVTAFAIAQTLGIATRHDQVVTGAELNEAWLAGEATFDEICKRPLVFSRVEARQKLQIVESLQRNGHYVAVTGDGVNDAPALRAAHVGVAMGKGGTDVARETAGLIVTDDNFASIVAGIEEGRIAYNNIRKVIFLLISTGAAELVLFLLTLLAGLPFPLYAVQLLWLNLVTNGIQDVALGFEPEEGNELARRPRPPGESIFNPIMIERVVLSATLIGTSAFLVYLWLSAHGLGQLEASNIVLLLMVLYENAQAFNSRSETVSLFRQDPMRNRLLLFGTIAAQLIHVGAMYAPGLSEVLRIQPIPLMTWLELLVLASGLVAVMEGYKAYRRRYPLD